MKRRHRTQSDLFREPDEPEPEVVERALAEENEMRDYARRILEEKRSRLRGTDSE